MPSSPPPRRALARAALLFAAPAALGAQPAGDRLQVHGFLTQAVARSDSLAIYGIGARATADYRAAALQVRFAATGNDVAVVQLAHRRVGTSPYSRFEPAVALQWVYYQRTLPGGVRAKLGRAPVPRGIYNEVRKAGTVLPFYRAPYSFYAENLEAVDGAVVSYVRPLGRWELETAAYGGALDFRFAERTPVSRPTFAVVNGAPTLVGIEPAYDSTITSDERARGAVGTQLWLATPVRGLRVGAGAARFRLGSLGIVSGEDGRSAGSTVQAAVDGKFARAQLRGEWCQLRVGEFMYTAYYAQGGVRLTERLSLNAQREQVNNLVAARPILLGVPAAQTPRFRIAGRNTLDYALGANLAVRPNVVLKVEGHDSRGATYARAAAGAAVGRYVITSAALSF
jgi:hypothetical protein